LSSFFRYFAIITVIFLILQFIPSYEKKNLKVDKSKEIEASDEVKSILKRSCYDCHSYETKWPWYADIAPMKWVVRRDVKEGRKALNFSIWKDYLPNRQKELKKRIYRSVNVAMPLPQYLWLHSEAKLSKKDKKIIQDWASEGVGCMDIDVR
jgi:hypothetical protein